MEMDDREVEADWEDVEEEGAEVDAGAGADGVGQQTDEDRVQADGNTEEAGPQRRSTDRRLKVVLGSTMIADASAWDGFGEEIYNATLSSTTHTKVFQSHTGVRQSPEQPRDDFLH